MRTIASLAAIAGAALQLWGCAGAGGARGGGEAQAGESSDSFPAPGELAAIARRPMPERVFADGRSDPATWELRQPPPKVPAQAERRPEDAFESLLAAEAVRRGGAVRLTEPMACLARLAGQYTLELQAAPGENLLDFLGARCGVVDPGIGTWFLVQPLRGGEPEEEVRRRVLRAVEEGLPAALGSGTAAGIWYGREKLRAVAMVVQVRQLVRLEAAPVAPGPDGHVILRGELLQRAGRVDRLEALINRGRYGYRRCALDPTVALPRFAVDCETDRGDESEVLEIAAFQLRRVMGPVVVRARVWPGGKLPAAFRLPQSLSLNRATGEKAALKGSDLAGAMVSSINEVRAAAGLAPIALAPSQSETADLLAPHYFAAQAGQDFGRIDEIAVGIMAGWQVGGLVRAGHFTSAATTDSEGEGRLLAGVLDRPSGRETLLDPDIRAVAVGIVRAEGRLGAVIGSYALLEQASPATESAAVVKRIDEARAKRGLQPSLPFQGIAGGVADLALAIGKGERDPKGAMQSVLDRALRSGGSGRVFAWVGFGYRLDGVALPEELVTAPTIRLAVGVARCKPERSPWAGYCVLVGAIQQTVTAQTEGEAGPGAPSFAGSAGALLALGRTKEGERP